MGDYESYSIWYLTEVEILKSAFRAKDFLKKFRMKKEIGSSFCKYQSQQWC